MAGKASPRARSASAFADTVSVNADTKEPLSTPLSDFLLGGQSDNDQRWTLLVAFMMSIDARLRTVEAAIAGQPKGGKSKGGRPKGTTDPFADALGALLTNLDTSWAEDVAAGIAEVREACPDVDVKTVKRLLSAYLEGRDAEQAARARVLAEEHYRVVRGSARPKDTMRKGLQRRRPRQQVGQK
jgi:hypothetical protein